MVAKVEVPVTTKELVVVALVKITSVALILSDEKFVVVLFVAVRLVIVALVVVEFPTLRSVILARVATREEIKELVEVLLVEKRLVAVSAEAEAFTSVV